MTFPTISAERLPLIITLAIVVCLGAGYYFVYIPGNEADVKQWKFRALQHVGQNIQAKTRLGHRQLNTYLHSKRLDQNKLEILNEDLGKLKSDNLPLSKIQSFNLQKRFVPESLAIGVRPVQLILTDKIQKNEIFYELKLTYDFEKFIKPLLPDQVFDAFMIVGEDIVLYENFTSGLDPAQDSLFRTCGKLSGALMTEREYAGTRYKLFVQPVDLNPTTKILLVGLLTNDHFLAAKTSLPPRLILFLITVFTCILITIPIIKLYQLADGDRLTVKDAISVTIVSCLLLSLLFFCFVKYSTVFAKDKVHAKRNLADAISAAFVSEIKYNYFKLDVLNACIEQDSRFDTSFSNLGKHAGGKHVRQQTMINAIIDGTDLDRFFWADTDGIEIRTWATGDPNFFPGQFNDRHYFKNTMNGRNYALSSVGKSELYVDQIVSWVSGRFLTVIAKPSRAGKAKVAVMVFNVKSLQKAKVPPGYTFAMVDYNGRVLYHSDSAKNLNENLFDEFSNKKDLQSSIRSGAHNGPAFTTEYYGREYEVQMRPVGGGLPFYMVIMEDLMFEEYRDINVYSFAFSMQLMFFGLIIVQVLSIFLFSTRKLRLKGRPFETSWLGPKQTSTDVYIMACIFNLGQLLLLEVFFTDETILSKIFMLLSSIALMPAFLNFLYFKKYSKEKGKERLAGIKLKSACIAAAFILPLDFLSYILPGESIWALAGLQLAICLLGSALYFQSWPSVIVARLENFICYEKGYTGMLVSWLLVSMGLPIVLFFKAAYNYDQHLIARYIQLEMAEANAGETSRLLRKNGDVLTADRKKKIANSFYRDHYWVNSVFIDSAKGRTDELDTTAIGLLRSFHLYSSDKIPDRIPINHSYAFDFSFYFNNLLRQNPNEQGASVTYYRLSDHDDLVIRSALLDFRLLDVASFSGLLPLLVFLAILVGFCFIVFGLVRKIFSLDLVGEKPSPPFNFAAWHRSTGADKVFLIGFSGVCPHNNPLLAAHVLNLAEMPLTEPPSNSEWMRKVTAAIHASSAVVILEHFEHDFKSVEVYNRKLELLEKVLRSGADKKLLICSAIHPAAMLAAKATTDNAARNVSSQFEERWYHALRAFRIVIDPVAVPASSVDVNSTDTQIFDGYVERYHHYFSIWQSLSAEEKFTLYDLAEDGLANTYDSNAFRMLIRRGLIVQKSGRFRLFDKSFRNFILTGLSSSELSSIMEKINDNTNWNRIRTPLMFVSLAILVFIISSQREASVKLLTTLGALATAIPALINLLSAISGANKKPAN